MMEGSLVLPLRPKLTEAALSLPIPYSWYGTETSAHFSKKRSFSKVTSGEQTAKQTHCISYNRRLSQKSSALQMTMPS